MEISNCIKNSIICPTKVTSRHQIRYTESSWRVHQFKIFSGEVICTVAVLRMDGSLFLWIGSGTNRNYMLNEISLGMPCGGRTDQGTAGGGLASSLLGTEGTLTSMARRLAVMLKRPIYLCSGSDYDKFTMPLIERGLVAEIKSRPECF